MAGDADILWAVEIDAQEGLRALETSLDAAQEQLAGIDAEAKRTGASLNRLLTITFDGSALDKLRESINLLNETLAKPSALPDMPAPPAPAPAPAPVAPTTRAAATTPMGEMFQRLHQPAEPEPEKAQGPAVFQPGMASEPIRQAREEMTALQRTADGVSASLRLARENLFELKVSPDFLASINLIQKDFLAGRATADESLKAIAGIQRDAVAQVVDAKRREKEEFIQAKQAELEAVREAERQKRAEEKRTAEAAAASRERLQQMTSVAQGLAGTAGSVAASFVQMRVDSLRAAGATEQMLYSLNQAQTAIPHLVGIGTSIGAMMSGGLMGKITGGLGIVGSLVGMMTSLVKPPPLPEQRKEGLEDTFSRVQQGALRTDGEVLSIQRGLLAAVRKIAGTVTGTSASGSPTVAP